ncbi:hypothetical protein Slin15195_G111460 [Septoria linicola]|uniref:Uncharacterized protein n=1 Tax=Septoria linicola TaxID=215465 RepID=A0A9Q9EPK6_9PEZI|nr:hypothetical protein Slin15195_G111460 [Septoria linicola]
MASEPLIATLPPGSTAQTFDLLTERLDRLARDVMIEARRDHLTRDWSDGVSRRHLLDFADAVDMRFENVLRALRFFFSAGGAPSDKN